MLWFPKMFVHSNPLGSQMKEEVSEEVRWIEMAGPEDVRGGWEVSNTSRGRKYDVYARGGGLTTLRGGG